jgi:multicomponent Na+:H+ antiporter subunit D
MFLYSGELKEELGINKDEKYDGIFKYDKIGFAAFTMMGLSLSGIPILPGFISKLYYGKILFEAGNMLIGVLVVFSGLLTLSYILPMVIRGGFKNGHEELEPISNNRRWILYIDMAILIILSVVSKDMIDFIVANVNLWR